MWCSEARTQVFRKTRVNISQNMNWDLQMYRTVLRFFLFHLKNKIVGRVLYIFNSLYFSNCRIFLWKNVSGAPELSKSGDISAGFSLVTFAEKYSYLRNEFIESLKEKISTPMDTCFLIIIWTYYPKLVVVETWCSSITQALQDHFWSWQRQL